MRTVIGNGHYHSQVLDMTLQGDIALWSLYINWRRWIIISVDFDYLGLDVIFVRKVCYSSD